ncbi:MAG: asparaginase [Selenomonadaceae bacterium]|nr:asparaginase [Selenomonadaceae bacterium]
MIRVKIIATGGTIAGVGKSGNTGYQAGALGINDLLKKVPGIKNYAAITQEDFCRIDSKDLTAEILLGLSRRVQEIFRQNAADAIVITHGTDTLEETAYFLHLTIRDSRPIVLTGAMRPATALSADGEANLLNAVRVAAHPDSMGRGVLVTLNEKIDSARDVTKTNTLAVEAFRSPGMGSLGCVLAGNVAYYRRSTRAHTIDSEFNLEAVKTLPKVKIIYGAACDDSLFVEAALAAKVPGLVYAGMGNGSVPQEMEKALAEAARQGCVVVRSSRVGNGAVTCAEESYRRHNFVEGDTLTPQKARILLQLALTKTKNPAEIQKMFWRY